MPETEAHGLTKLEDFSVPKLRPLVTPRGGMHPQFAVQYRRYRKLLLDVFPYFSDGARNGDSAIEDAWKYEYKGETRLVALPPEDPAEFLRRYDRSDTFSRRLTEEGFTVLEEHEDDDWKIGDIKLYQTQIAQGIWTMMHLPTGKRSERAALQIRGHFGVGKTAVAGMVNHAVRNYQVREAQEGRDPGMAGFLALRDNALRQNALGERRYLRLPPYNVPKEKYDAYYRALEKLYGKEFTSVFKRKEWPDLFNEECDSFDDALKRMRGVITRRGGIEPLEQFQGSGSYDEITRMICALAQRTHTLRRDIYDEPQLEEAPARIGVDRDTRDIPLGHALYAFDEPERYPFKPGHRAFVLNGARQSLADEDPERPDAFYLMLRANLMSPRSLEIEHTRSALQRMLCLTIDEVGGFNRSLLEYPFKQAGSEHMPVFVGLTGEKRTNHSGWSPSPDIDRKHAMELRLVAPMGGTIFPSADSRKIAPPKTEEAWALLRDEFFDHPRIPTKYGLRYPYAGTTLLITPSSIDDVREYAHRMRLEYEKRMRGKNLEGVESFRILCYDGKTGSDKQEIEDIVAAGGEPGEALMVVSPPTGMDKALSLDLDCLVIAEKIQNRHVRQQIAERLRHSTRHRGANHGYRTYLMEQIFSPYDQPVLLEYAKEIGVPEGERQRWVRLMAFDKPQRDQDRKLHGLQEESRLLPDPTVPRKEQRTWKPKKATPLTYTSKLVIKMRQDREERRKRREEMKRMLALKEAQESVQAQHSAALEQEELEPQDDVDPDFMDVPSVELEDDGEAEADVNDELDAEFDAPQNGKPKKSPADLRREKRAKRIVHQEFKLFYGGNGVVPDKLHKERGFFRMCVEAEMQMFAGREDLAAAAGRREFRETLKIWLRERGMPIPDGL